MPKILFALFLILLSFCRETLSEPICPPVGRIKNLKLIKAIHHSFDPTCWNFASEAIEYNGINWNVWFGTFLDAISREEEALKKGQEIYRQAEFRITKPSPYQNQQGVTICDYMPTGDLYWISAVSPPVVDHMP